MIERFPSSREQFQRVRAELAGRNGQPHGVGHKRRDRSAATLVWGFLGLLRGHWVALALALMTLTAATLLALVPPAATKVLIDYVLGSKRLPNSVPDWVPRDPWPLLLAVAVTVLVVSLAKTAIQTWGSWHATRITKLVQMSVRKLVFAHVMRLPLHRIQELKSGGAASILRQDAASVGDLVFGMIYNPWRAVIQLVGSFCILAWVDWRLLVGAIVAVPLVYMSHRTWISRIRPQHRRIRAEREKVDSMATEAFGGMRVVRAFGRQRSETSRIMRGNHLMGRQELYAWWWMRGIEILWEILIPLSGGAADLRRLASDLWPPLARRPGDVSGVSRDAARPAGRAGTKCGRVSERPLGARPHSRPDRGSTRNGIGIGGESRPRRRCRRRDLRAGVVQLPGLRRVCLGGHFARRRAG
jgi:ATP-binding cassette subfamily B protein/subfamily B ATP-binding cassette protein MsbA